MRGLCICSLHLTLPAGITASSTLHLAIIPSLLNVLPAIAIYSLASVATMLSFLSLPPEIRFHIYRDLRSFKSPLIKSIYDDGSDALGYCSFGFHSRILEVNRQVSDEAKEVFYGENCWTFFASQRYHFIPLPFHMGPMVLILPFIRKAHIRFGMFHWLFWESCGLPGSTYENVIKTAVKQICQIFQRASALRTVKIIWTETGSTGTQFHKPVRLERDRVRYLISEVLQPLTALPTTCDLQKSNIMVAFWNGVKATDLESDFSNAVDKVLTLHRSRKALIEGR